MSRWKRLLRNRPPLFATSFLHDIPRRTLVGHPPFSPPSFPPFPPLPPYTTVGHTCPPAFRIRPVDSPTHVSTWGETRVRSPLVDAPGHLSPEFTIGWGVEVGRVELSCLRVRSGTTPSRTRQTPGYFRAGGGRTWLDDHQVDTSSESGGFGPGGCRERVAGMRLQPTVDTKQHVFPWSSTKPPWNGCAW